jgi:hypothetical protein
LEKVKSDLWGSTASLLRHSGLKHSTKEGFMKDNQDQEFLSHNHVRNEEYSVIRREPNVSEENSVSVYSTLSKKQERSDQQNSCFLQTIQGIKSQETILVV